MKVQPNRPKTAKASDLTKSDSDKQTLKDKVKGVLASGFGLFKKPNKEKTASKLTVINTEEDQIFGNCIELDAPNQAPRVQTKNGLRVS